MRDFTRRISQASRTELVVILYDIILTDLEEAEKKMQAGDLKAFEKEMKHAGKFVVELLASLDLRLGISYELRRLYLYIQKEMITAMIRREVTSFPDIRAVIFPLRSAFVEISKLDQSGAVMKNTQQLYAGLTYGKGNLNEMVIGKNEKNRGFLA